MSWLRIEDEGEIRWIVIDRPERKNAIPFDGWPDLRDAFVQFEGSAARVLILTGAGGDFCAGADLDQTNAADMVSVADRHARMKLVHETAIALHRSTKPTIAAVEGVAVGAGMNLAIGCDVVLAADTARFSQIFVRRGLTIDSGGTWLLPRLVGLQRAKELSLSGRIIGAEEAVDYGIALEVLPAAQLAQRATTVAESFLEGAPLAQMFTKQGLNAAYESSFEESISWEGQSQAIAFATEDVTEGINAFLQKRDPDWKGR